MAHRVVITGMGVISAAGLDLDYFWDSVKHGNSGIVPIKRFDTTTFRTKIAAEIQEFCAEDYIEPKQISLMDRFSHYAVAASQQALNDAGVDYKEGNNDIGVILGTSAGGIYTHEQLGPTQEAVPFLSKMPLLGWLCQKSSKEENKRELLIFIAPTIVQPRRIAAT